MTTACQLAVGHTSCNSFKLHHSYIAANPTKQGQRAFARMSGHVNINPTPNSVHGQGHDKCSSIHDHSFVRLSAACRAQFCCGQDHPIQEQQQLKGSSRYTSQKGDHEQRVSQTTRHPRRCSSNPSRQLQHVHDSRPCLAHSSNQD